MVFQYVTWGSGFRPFGFSWKFEQRFVVVKGFAGDMTA